MNGQEKHLKTPDQIIAENALRESEERLRLFTAASNSIVFRVNADWSRVENLVGKELIADTPDLSTTGLINIFCRKTSNLLRSYSGGHYRPIYF